MKVLSTSLYYYDMKIGISLTPVQYSQCKPFNLTQDWGTPD